jgi:hypothetical protein
MGSVLRWLFDTRIRRRIAVLAAAVALVALGLWTHARVERALLEIRANELTAVLEADIAAMEVWIQGQKLQLQQLARDPQVIRLAEELLEIGREGEPAIPALLQAEARRALVEVLAPYKRETGSGDIPIFNERGFLVFNNYTEPMAGMVFNDKGFAYLGEVLSGRSVFVRPFRVEEIFRNPPTEPSTMYTALAVPLRDEDQRIVGMLAAVKAAYGPFSDILETARLGETDEIFAFDHLGVMLSKSRFDEELREIGLVPSLDDTGRSWDRSAQLNVQVRDPGGDLGKGHVSELEPSARPLTKLAALAIAARDKGDPTVQRGLVLEPYRTYRGVEVIGAWQWLPEHEFGVAIEMEKAEAFAPLHYLNITFGILLLVLTGAVTVTFASSFSAVRLRRRVRELRQLGQYSLREQIGEGGMGKIYLAEHAMLKRPTAIKILPSEMLSVEYIERFEREVQLVSQLSHPNTIEIYDYGRTPDDVLYYAMEHLDGLNLAQLVSSYGPVPPDRVVHILKQVCGSLHEAHDKGFIHRDIKPLNIMVCTKGGVYDVVKVLDFGLAKRLASEHARDLTGKAEIGGTPMYMAPERLTAPDAVDARADVYGVGALAYYLLSAQPVFPHMEDIELLHHIVNTEPEPLSEVTTGNLPTELETLVMSCLAKEPEDRPQSVRELRERLETVPRISAWRQEDAARWWQESTHIRNQPLRD